MPFRLRLEKSHKFRHPRIYPLRGDAQVVTGYCLTCHRVHSHRVPEDVTAAELATVRLVEESIQWGAIQSPWR